MPRILTDHDVDALLPPPRALADVRTAFELLGAGEAWDEPRRRSTGGNVTLNVMSAIAPTLDAVAVKSYPVVRTGTNRASAIAVVVYTCETVCLLGTGFQAPAQVSALVDVLPKLRRVLVVGRDATRAAATAGGLRLAHPRLDVEAGTSPERAVPRADVVITATGAVEPLFDGGLLRAGTHVNAVGSNHAARRELDRSAFQRAAHVAVDSAAVAALECGDLLANGLDPAEATEFADIVAGRVPGRGDGDDITVFESHGLAIQDLVCAVGVLDGAREPGAAAEVPGESGEDA
ncbi:hypothetical protein QFW96_27910 [Saccharopolyspora sp. TS4A08]|uniref:Ornithine cyclodeaminase family protein n=1 Tax=Saccharopolyspora ipomoeae TaxID=3042027 RepID=A0ABT6PWS0_9PSEU|nr:hypothetical protein [Saccharopolyspora sp. TS4A08]MDI2032476.1 hypothetical protein [Saccharopolyspora sp. TS4A08]